VLFPVKDGNTVCVSTDRVGILCQLDSS